MSIKIIIADDYKIYRDGLKVGLSADENLEVIAEADNGQQLLSILETCTPDVIIMDLKMPVMDGMEATRMVRRFYPSIKILIVTMYEDEKFIIHMMEAGANGYLLKNAEPEDIRRSIHALHENGYYFNDLVNKAMLKRLVVKNNIKVYFNQDAELTDKELQVLRLICAEKTSAEIAKEMALSPRSVESIRMKLIEKIGVRNTAGLVMFAAKHGVVD